MIYTYDIYRYFLDGINKGGNFSINIAAFNRLINEWGQDEWIQKNVIYADIDQKLIDKLSPLKIITDGIFMTSERIDKANKYVLPPILCNALTNPVYEPSVKNYFQYPSNTNIELYKLINQVKYPIYMRLQNIEFRVDYLTGAICKKIGKSDWISAKVLRSDTEISNKKNPFRKPSETKFYYEILDDSIKLIYDGFVEGYDMKIKYFKYPRRIFLNEKSASRNDEQVGIPDYTGNVNGSINCEFHYPQKIEITNLAIRIFLERVKDSRYQSYLNEINIRQNG